MIMNLTGSGGATQPKLQVKDATPSGSQQIILPDTGYDGLSKVNLSAIPGDYIGPNVTRQSGGVYTPSTSSRTIVPANTYVTSAVSIAGDPALISSNIRSGASIFGVSGSYVGEGRFIYANMQVASPSGALYIDLPQEPRYIHYVVSNPAEPSEYLLVILQATRTSGSSDWNIVKAYGIDFTNAFVTLASPLNTPTISYNSAMRRLYINPASQLALMPGTIVYAYS